MLLAEVSLLTNDVILLANFYKELLDIDNGSNDSIHQFLISEGTTLSIYNDGLPKNNNNQNICLAFTVDDVDEEYQRLKNMGVTIIEKPQTQLWGVRNMHFCDPDGNHLYFRTLL